jgi:homoserine O-acetyltransferase
MTDIESIHNPEPASIGVVHYRDQHFAEPLLLDCGQVLQDWTIRYETYGVLNSERNNVILIEHALSGDHHAAGKYADDDRKPGWWDILIGPGKAFDTDRYFVVCSNVIGGCRGSTGPGSLNPETGKRYGMDFPIVTIRDMVRAQHRLIEELGIQSLEAVSGGSMGGMLSMEWAIRFPQLVRRVIPIATTTRQSPQAIAFDEVGRNAIMRDPLWNQGDYEPGAGPAHGLAVARMMAHITYLSEIGMVQKFGRRLRGKDQLDFTFGIEFEVESYLRHQGQSFIDRFDANTYLYLTKALDYFNLEQDAASLDEAFAPMQASALVMAFSSDWLYPPAQNKEAVAAMLRAGKQATYVEIESDYGHDAFLLEAEEISRFIRAFLGNDRD